MNLWCKRSVSFLLICCMVFGMAGVSGFAESPETDETVGENNAPLFVDVLPGTAYYRAVAYLYQHQVMQGMSADYFAPQLELSRAMTAATLFRLEHGRAAEADDVRDTPFFDVAAEDWFAPYISWAYESGIVLGVGNGHFAPHATVTREQFVTMLHRYAVPEHSTLEQMPSSTPISDWAVNAMYWAVSRSLLRDMEGGLLQPHASVSRADCAIMLMRFMTIDIAQFLWRSFDDYQHLFGNLVDAGVFDGMPDLEWRSFDNGLLLFVMDLEFRGGTITFAHVDYTDGNDRSRFHFWEIDGTSTIADVEALFADRSPDHIEMWSDYGPYAEKIISYTYVLSEINDHFVRFSFELDGTVMAITHAASPVPPPPPSPNEIHDMSELLGRYFDDVSHLLGNLTYTGTFEDGVEYRQFDTGLVIAVKDPETRGGTIILVHICSTQSVYHTLFHFWGIDATSTIADVEALFDRQPDLVFTWGPDFPGRVSLYQYINPDGLVGSVAFHFDLNGIVTAITLDSTIGTEPPPE